MQFLQTDSQRLLLLIRFVKMNFEFCSSRILILCKMFGKAKQTLSVAEFYSLKQLSRSRDNRKNKISSNTCKNN